MAGNYMSMANLASDTGFRSRVQASMISSALNVASEAWNQGADPNQSVYSLRHQLAVQVLNNASGYLDRFAWAAAVNATVAGDVGAPVSIASSAATNPATVTTSTVHGLSTGQFAEISGHLVNTSINGTFPVTVTSTTVFTVPVLGNGTGVATGTVTLQPPDADIQNAVSGAFSDIAGVGSVNN